MVKNAPRGSVMRVTHEPHVSFAKGLNEYSLVLFGFVSAMTSVLVARVTGSTSVMWRCRARIGEAGKTVWAWHQNEASL